MTRNFNLQTRPSSFTSSLHHQVTSSGRIVPITPTHLLLLVVDQCLVLISSGRNGMKTFEEFGFTLACFSNVLNTTLFKLIQ